MIANTNDPVLGRLIDEIRAAVRDEVRAARYGKPQRTLDPRKQEVIKVLTANHKRKVIDVCWQMDALQDEYPTLPKYRPIRSWKEARWVHAYRRYPDRVHAYVSKCRRLLTR
jgi:hypothetical protein